MSDEKPTWLCESDYPLCTPRQIRDASLDELRKDERIWIAYERGWCDLLKAYLDARLMQAETSVVLGPTLARRQSQDVAAAGDDAGQEPQDSAAAATTESLEPSQHDRHRLCCWRCGFRRAVDASDKATATHAKDEEDNKERVKEETDKERANDETGEERANDETMKERVKDEAVKEHAEDETVKERVEEEVAEEPAEDAAQAMITFMIATPDSAEFDPLSASYIVRPENVDDFPDYSE